MLKIHKGKNKKVNVSDNHVKKDAGSPLVAAIKDLEAEIRRLTTQKNNLKNELGQVTSVIDFDREKEKELQQKIASLLAKAASLTEKKKRLETQLDKLSDKMSKISKIKSEMADI